MTDHSNEINQPYYLCCFLITTTLEILFFFVSSHSSFPFRVTYSPFRAFERMMNFNTFFFLSYLLHFFDPLKPGLVSFFLFWLFGWLLYASVQFEILLRGSYTQSSASNCTTFGKG